MVPPGGMAPAGGPLTAWVDFSRFAFPPAALRKEWGTVRCLLFLLTFAVSAATARGAAGLDPAYENLKGGVDQYAAFPRPLEMYPDPGGSLMDTLATRASMEPFNVAATIIFVLAILHTFAAGPLTRLAHRYEHEHEERLRKSGHTVPEGGVAPVSFRGTLFHFLGEVEAIFGIWIIALAAAATWFHSWTDFKLYLSHDRNFTEPLFVIVIMAIAASRPILRFSERVMSMAAGLGGRTPGAWWLSVMIIAPLLGSFITEPAAMTIGALLLAKKFYRHHPSPKLAYASLGLLFVNISVGGTLTHFAAPPVLMVAGKWGWDLPFMLQHFGWKAATGIVIATGLFYAIFRKELFAIADQADGKQDGQLHPAAWEDRETGVPAWVTGVHLAFLAWTVYSAHYPVLFIGGFLFFLAFVIATGHHQNAVRMKSPLLVGFFLAGLVVHGGCQGWWIAPVITTLPDHLLMLGAAILTAFNDNAAITYLAAQVDGISDGAKLAVVAGAVAGGGLTVIANAPNPAGQSILGRFFKDGVSPLYLLTGAIIPTVIVYACLALLP